MAGAVSSLSLKQARALLGVDARASQADVRNAFRQAAKHAHPDRAGGETERFHRISEAYRRLQAGEHAAEGAEPAARGAADPVLSISPIVAWAGGEARHVLPDGRRMKLRLPPGLRAGDQVRADGEVFRVEIKSDGDLVVRGDDLWMTVEVPSATLAQGGRVAVVTPIGQRILWVNRKAAERRLVRAPGLGLPARGRRRQGHLFLRLAPKKGLAESAARLLLRRFAAAWAA
jgi:curved DNA-binding protein